jgi:hypothetical protein
VIRAISRVRGAWDRYFFSPAGPVDLCVGRIVFYSLAFFYYLPQDFSEWGTVAGEFWMPTSFFSALRLPALGPGAITVVEIVWKMSLALAAVGLLARWEMLVSFAGSFYLLGLPHNFGQTQHFDTLVVIVAGILAASRAGDAWSLDALRRSARDGSAVLDSARPKAEYRWPVRTVWVITALVFFAAGVSKLRHSGLSWIFSDHLAILLVRHQYYVSDGEPLTAWGPIIAGYPWAARALAAVAVLTEALYPLALFSTRARMLLVPAGVCFLVGIRLLMGPTFEAFVICNVFWVPWEWVGRRLSVHAGIARSARGAERKLPFASES